MPLILERTQVLNVYAEAADRKWVLPTFNVENLTTIEAILEAVHEYGQSIGVKNLPIIIGITNKYQQRPQSVYYTQSRKWYLGLQLFLADLKVLTSPESPYANVRVMIHLDHIQWDDDEELLGWDMQQFSSIMYDASTLSFEQNMKKTADFTEQHGKTILIEGACDEVGKPEEPINEFTKPGLAEKYYQETGVDLIVANLGTEHRASTANLQYRSELARKITERIGPRLCLHGTSSVSAQQLNRLFNDGIRKVNIWTALERDSSPVLFQDMLTNAIKITGPDKAKDLLAKNLLGNEVDYSSQQSVQYFTTTYRQEIIFRCMKKTVTGYLCKWYV